MARRGDGIDPLAGGSRGWGSERRIGRERTGILAGPDDGYQSCGATPLMISSREALGLLPIHSL
jgi:hypothetical protein